MEKKFGYSRTEKLKQKKDITLLFEKGKWKSAGRVRIIICKNDSEENSEENKVGVSVSKRFFKNGVKLSNSLLGKISLIKLTVAHSELNVL